MAPYINSEDLFVFSIIFLFLLIIGGIVFGAGYLVYKDDQKQSEAYNRCMDTCERVFIEDKLIKCIDTCNQGIYQNNNLNNTQQEVKNER